MGPWTALLVARLLNRVRCAGVAVPGLQHHRPRQQVVVEVRLEFHMDVLSRRDTLPVGLAERPGVGGPGRTADGVGTRDQDAGRNYFAQVFGNKTGLVLHLEACNLFDGGCAALADDQVADVQAADSNCLGRDPHQDVNRHIGVNAHQAHVKTARRAWPTGIVASGVHSARITGRASMVQHVFVHGTQSRIACCIGSTDCVASRVRGSRWTGNTTVGLNSFIRGTDCWITGGIAAGRTVASRVRG